MSDQRDFQVQEPAGRKTSGFWRLIFTLLRVAAVMVIAIALALAAYFGVPRLYRDLIQPVQHNTERIEELEASLDTMLQRQTDQTASLAERLAGLEGDLSGHSEAVAEIQARLDSIRSTMEDQGEQISSLSSLTSQVADLEEQLRQTSDDLAELRADLEQGEQPAERLERKLQMIRAMALINRARMWLMQGNLGLASQEVVATLDAMATLADDSPEEEAKALLSVRDRLVQAKEDMRTSPVVADGELEIAWQLLLEMTAP